MEAQQRDRTIADLRAIRNLVERRHQTGQFLVYRSHRRIVKSRSIPIRLDLSHAADPDWSERGRPGEEARGCPWDPSHSRGCRARSASLPSEVWDFIQGEWVGTHPGGQCRPVRPVRPASPALVDVSATLARGSALEMPVGVAPMAYHRLADDEGETATARAAGGGAPPVSPGSSPAGPWRRSRPPPPGRSG